MDLFPRIKEYNSKEFATVIEENGIDIIVFIDLQDSAMSEDYYTHLDGSLDSVTVSNVMFEFTFQPTGYEDPILVTQVTAHQEYASEWATVNATAAKRAVDEYCVAAGIEQLGSVPSSGVISHLRNPVSTPPAPL